MIISQIRATPNILTLTRLIFIPFAVIAVLYNHYAWALSIFLIAGITDGLDGLLARLLQQKTVLGQYLDPIADKLLLSTMFLMLTYTHKIPLLVTVMVFSRDIIILVVCSVIYAIGAMQTFQPSWLGKTNTAVQILTVPLVLLREMSNAHWIILAKRWGVWSTFALTILSGVHYVWRLAFDLRGTSAKAEGQGQGR